MTLNFTLRCQYGEPSREANIEAKHKIEIEFWRNWKDESPDADSIGNVVNKVSDAGVLLDCLNRHKESLQSTEEFWNWGKVKGGHRASTNICFPTHM